MCSIWSFWCHHLGSTSLGNSSVPPVLLPVAHLTSFWGLLHSVSLSFHSKEITALTSLISQILPLNLGFILTAFPYGLLGPSCRKQGSAIPCLALVAFLNLDTSFHTPFILASVMPLRTMPWQTKF